METAGWGWGSRQCTGEWSGWPPDAEAADLADGHRARFDHRIDVTIGVPAEGALGCDAGDAYRPSQRFAAERLMGRPGSASRTSTPSRMTGVPFTMT